jgi:hypothetical protein
MNLHNYPYFHNFARFHTISLTPNIIFIGLLYLTPRVSHEVSHFELDKLSTIILPCAEGDWEDYRTKRVCRVT